MTQHIKVSAVIPAQDEAQAIGAVVSGLLSLTNGSGRQLISEVIVCDNGSRDNTAQVAEDAGAVVVHQSKPGYGIACQIAVQATDNANILLFVDGDYSCDLNKASHLLEAVMAGADLAIGSRTLGRMEAGALTTTQRFGNNLASFMINKLFDQQVTDLGPFRAICKDAYDQLDMQDERFGWTVEMQTKAVIHGMHIKEIPVNSYRRIGTSKISGTLKGSIGAGYGILITIAKLWWQQRGQPKPSKKASRRHTPCHYSATY